MDCNSQYRCEKFTFEHLFTSPGWQSSDTYKQYEHLRGIIHFRKVTRKSTGRAATHRLLNAVRQAARLMQCLYTRLAEHPPVCESRLA